MPVAFTERELDIMAILWTNGPSTVAEVRAHLDDELSHNTVATMLTILETKGYAAHTEEGRAFRYHPTVDREEAGRSAFARLADKVFDGSAEALLTHFVRDRRLTKAELERIRSVLEERIESEQPRRGRGRNES
ncbi:MAG TPA: BlaI/MecI/CopY family transcriptional regulator [Gemmatimonadaceae bacterium]|jgi:predicted transcriptional regulator